MNQTFLVSKAPDFQMTNSNISQFFNASEKCTYRSRAKKKKPFARYVSRKRSWSSSFPLHPMRRISYVGHRVDGITGPFKEGNLLPF
jgi:hypothetical protein